MSQPKRSNPVNNVFSIILGSFLLIEGIWGLFSEVVFGVLTTNMVHAVIHILLGIAAIVLGIKQNAGGFCTFLGLLLLSISVIWFIQGADSFLIRLLNVNKPVAVLNAIVGILSLAVVYYRRPGVLKN